MISSKKFRFICVTAIIVALHVSSGCSLASDRLNVSVFPHLQKGERIIGFSATIISAPLVSLPKIPVGWDFNIVHSFLWKIELNAKIAVGAAAIGENELDDFTNFMVLGEKEENPKFDIQIDMTVTANFETSRIIHFSMHDVQLEAVKQEEKGGCP